MILIYYSPKTWLILAKMPYFEYFGLIGSTLQLLALQHLSHKTVFFLIPAHIILTLSILNGFVHITKTPHKSFITQEYRKMFQMYISLIELSVKMVSFIGYGNGLH